MNKEDFKNWWYHEGSQAPYTHHDCEEHCMRMCEIAWSNGAFKEREACAKLCDVLAVSPAYASDITKLAAMAIRARKQE
jgi:hypothetical protein